MVILQLIPADPKYSEQVYQLEKQNRQFFERYVQARDPSYYAPKIIEYWLTKAAQEFTTQQSYQFLIFIQKYLVGRLNFYNASQYQQHSIEIGYRLGKQYQGRGIMTQAITLGCKFIFQKTIITRIYARVALDNQKSQQILLNNQFMVTKKIERGLLLNTRHVDIALLEKRKK